MPIRTKLPKLKEKLLEDTLAYLDNLYESGRTPVDQFEKCLKDVFGFNNDYVTGLIMGYWKQQRGLNNR